MSNKKRTPAELPALIELHELTETRQALETRLYSHTDSFVLFKGKRWTYDDLLEVLVKWYKLAKQCGIPHKDTLAYLRIEKQRLKSLGLTLN